MKRFCMLITGVSLALLGWQPRLVIDEALDWIADWYVSYFDGAPANALCLDQIQRFESLAP